MSARFMWGAVLLAGAWLGCSVTNTDHCGNNQGDKTCAGYGAVTPYCSLCVGENNGCVAAPVADESCRMASDSGTPGTTTTGTSTTTIVDPPVTGTTVVDPTTGTTVVATDTSTTDATTTMTGETTTTTEATTSTGTSTGATTAGETSGTSGTSTGEPEMCGNGVLDEGEACDGAKLDGKSCDDFAGYGGGTLKCSAACDYDKSLCCLGLNTDCNIFASKCCPNSTCALGKCVAN